MVLGYVPKEKEDGTWEWKREVDAKVRARTGFWIRGEKEMDSLPVIEEGPMSVLERALLGFV
jgi:hypothetical protein